MEEVNVRCDEKERWLIMERGPWSVVCISAPLPLRANVRKGQHELAAASETGVSARRARHHPATRLGRNPENDGVRQRTADSHFLP